MRISLNGEPRDVAGPTLAAVLDELGFTGTVVATAINDEFVPATNRGDVGLTSGDRLEVLAPMQGG